eukprot:TRINITY_DN14364_c0_g1_i1.p1 TRINITY_DN14364_c0_g1~~TRINITY_DN14364_c0_g1_i1.p1  ORF type:complete len:538 (+),score=65.33 TRINITY_DN14364_c0_g1_i1:64-1677(+)
MCIRDSMGAVNRIDDHKSQSKMETMQLYSKNVSVKHSNILHKDVAVKSIFIPIHDDKKGHERRFLAEREISILQLLSENNPNIMKFFGARYENGNVDIIVIEMECCNEGNLEEYVAKTYKDRGGKVPEIKGLMIMRDLVNGYKAFYDNRIVHRDLKPDNILIDNGRAKICDMGVARNLECNKTTTLSKRGNHQFKAPELMRFIYETRDTEVYSFGLLFLWMLIGDKKFNEDYLQIRKGNHAKSIPTDIQLSEESKFLLDAMLQEDPLVRVKWETVFTIFGVRGRTELRVEEIQQNIRNWGKVVVNLLPETKNEARRSLQMEQELTNARNMMTVLNYLKQLSLGPSRFTSFLKKETPIIAMRLIILFMCLYLVRFREYLVKRNNLPEEIFKPLNKIRKDEETKVLHELKEYIESCIKYVNKMENENAILLFRKYAHRFCKHSKEVFPDELIDELKAICKEIVATKAAHFEENHTWIDVLEEIDFWIGYDAYLDCLDERSISFAEFSSLREKGSPTFRVQRATETIANYVLWNEKSENR